MCSTLFNQVRKEFGAHATSCLISKQRLLVILAQAEAVLVAVEVVPVELVLVELVVVLVAPCHDKTIFNSQQKPLGLLFVG